MVFESALVHIFPFNWGLKSNRPKIKMSLSFENGHISLKVNFFPNLHGHNFRGIMYREYILFHVLEESVRVRYKFYIILSLNHYVPPHLVYSIRIVQMAGQDWKTQSISHILTDHLSYINEGDLTCDKLPWVLAVQHIVIT